VLSLPLYPVLQLDRFECAKAVSSIFATPKHIEVIPDKIDIFVYISHHEHAQVDQKGSSVHCAFALPQRSQDFTNTKLQGYQDGIPRRTYVSVKTIAAAQFQSESPIEKSSQLRADKLIHNITKSCRLARESIDNLETVTRPITVLYPNVREKFANIFYRKRKKKSNQKVSFNWLQLTPSQLKTFSKNQNPIFAYIIRISEFRRKFKKKTPLTPTRPHAEGQQKIWCNNRWTNCHTKKNP